MAVKTERERERRIPKQTGQTDQETLLSVSALMLTDWKDSYPKLASDKIRVDWDVKQCLFLQSLLVAARAVIK